MEFAHLFENDMPVAQHLELHIERVRLSIVDPHVLAVTRVVLASLDAALGNFHGLSDLDELVHLLRG